jgi:hypothetical protein
MRAVNRIGYLDTSSRPIGSLAWKERLRKNYDIYFSENSFPCFCSDLCMASGSRPAADIYDSKGLT